jgi:hypothetical protein
MRISFRDLRQLSFRRRIDRIEILPRMRGAEFTIDEVLIARLDPDVIAPLRRGRISPTLTENEPPVVRRKRAAVVGQRLRFAHCESDCSGRFFTGHGFVVGTLTPAAHFKKSQPALAYLQFSTQT